VALVKKSSSRPLRKLAPEFKLTTVTPNSFLIGLRKVLAAESQKDVHARPADTDLGQILRTQRMECRCLIWGLGSCSRAHVSGILFFDILGFISSSLVFPMVLLNFFKFKIFLFLLI
jgi:hypothetical protein